MSSQLPEKLLHMHILVREEQRKKINLLAYYSGKSISEIIRVAVDRLDGKEFAQHE